MVPVDSHVLLGVTGTGKVLTVFGGAAILDTSDPLVGLPFWYLLLFVGVAEMSVAMLCFNTARAQVALILTGWLATGFALYRWGLWFIDWHRPCGCLGNLTDMLHLSPPLADNITKLALAYLLLGSYATLLWEWRRGQVAGAVVARSR